MGSGINKQKSAALKCGVFLFFAPLAALFVLTVVIFGMKTYLLNEASIRCAEAARSAVPFAASFLGNIYKNAAAFSDNLKITDGKNSELFFEINPSVLVFAEYNETGNAKNFFVNSAVPAASQFYKQLESLVKERATEFNPLPFDKTLFFDAELSGREIIILRFISRQKTPAIIAFSADELKDAFSNENTFILLYNAGKTSVPFFSSVKLNEENANIFSSDSVRAERVINPVELNVPFDIKIVSIIPKNKVFEPLEIIKKVNISIAAIVVFIGFLLSWFFSRYFSGTEETEITPEIRAVKENKLSYIQFFSENSIDVPNGELENGTASLLFFNIETENSFSHLNEKEKHIDTEEKAGRFREMIYGAASIVVKTGGVIDSFQGAGFQAHFGLSLNAANTRENAETAICAALLIRAYFKDINAERSQKRQPPVITGCAVSEGAVFKRKTSDGQALILGKAAWLQGRAEARTMPYGVDIVITENTMRTAGRYFFTCEMPPFFISNREERLFAVVNVKDALIEKKLFETLLQNADNVKGGTAREILGANGPRNIVAFRRILGISTPDLRKFIRKKLEIAK